MFDNLSQRLQVTLKRLRGQGRLTEENTREALREVNLAPRPPAVILVAGLQGSGKTTTVAKLARLLREREKKSVMVVSADVYRPAAIEQLQKLAAAVGAEFFLSRADQKPVDIARHAVEEARKRMMDVLIVDSAGRLHVDEPMMQEIRAGPAALGPVGARVG